MKNYEIVLETNYTSNSDYILLVQLIKFKILEFSN